MGEALTGPITAMGTQSRSPHKALIVAEVGAALCDQLDARRADLRGLRDKHSLAGTPSGSLAAVTDARLTRMRTHTRTARRFYRSFQHLETAFGSADQACPSIKKNEEVVYLLGLLGGLFSVLHNGVGGREAGVPLDTVAKVGRAATCLDNERWWHLPKTIQASAWACIPGSGPEGVDPWSIMNEEATAGDLAGMRAARAVLALVAANAGQTDTLESAIQAHAASIATVPSDPEWVLLDEIALALSLHESDLIWTEAKGHRTPTFGELPNSAPPPTDEVPNPFDEGDPFAEAPAAPAPTESHEKSNPQ